jgi:hypothetical protein
VYCGKQHDIFKGKCASDANDLFVFSIKGMEKTKDGDQPFILHLEADSEATVDGWMDGISHLLEEGGRTVESLDEAGEKQATNAKKKKSRMSVAPPKKKEKVEATSDDPFETLGQNGQDYADQAVLNPETTIDSFFPSQEPTANPFDTAASSDPWDPFASLVDQAADVAPAADYDPFGEATAAEEKKEEAPAAAASSGCELTDYIAAIGLGPDILKILKDEDVDMDALRSFEPADLRRGGGMSNLNRYEESSSKAKAGMLYF